MNLICVQKSNNCCYDNGEPACGPDVEVGSYYTAYDVIEFSDGVYYFLTGFPDDVVYHSCLFATLPDNTADEIEAETKEAIVNLETALP